MKKVAIQGVHGCFHEQAARIYYGNDIEIVECSSFEKEFSAVENGEADAIVMAIENTVAGGLLPNYSLLQKSSHKIKGEVHLPICQNLMALPGQRIEDLTEVRSHYMAIAQTRMFFQRYPNIRLVEWSDTAKSAADIAADNLKGVGAIASSLAAEIYKLEVLAPSIETHKQNCTRFLILDDALQPFEKEINKSSVCFTLKHKTGSLSQILSIFSFYDLNLTKIQSLPLVGQNWQYFFYVDFTFESYSHYKEALNAVRPLLNNITILGEYKSFE